jgi:hypothetical protein
MFPIHPQYIIDHTGKTVSVVIPVDEFKHILEALEEIDDNKLYDDAKNAAEPSIPLNEAFRLIESAREQQRKAESLKYFSELRDEMARKGLTQEGLDDILKGED